MESLSEHETDTKSHPKRRRVSRAQRIAAIEAELAQLKARENEERRKQETRCKIVLGGTVLSAWHDDPQLADVIKKLITERVTRESDRKAIAHLL